MYDFIGILLRYAIAFRSWERRTALRELRRSKNESAEKKKPARLACSGGTRSRVHLTYANLPAPSPLPANEYPNSNLIYFHRSESVVRFCDLAITGVKLIDKAAFSARGTPSPPLPRKRVQHTCV